MRKILIAGIPSLLVGGLLLWFFGWSILVGIATTPLWVWFAALSLLVLLIWGLRYIPDGLLNGASFLFGGTASTALLLLIQQELTVVWSDTISPGTLQWLTWSLASVLAGSFFVLGCYNTPLPTGWGAVITFFGARLRCEVREGPFWCAWFLGFMISQLIKVQKHPTSEIESVAITPARMKVTGKLSLEIQVFSVHLYLGHDDQEHALLFAADGALKAAIERDVILDANGKSVPTMTSQMKGHVQKELREHAAHMGVHVEVVLRELLLPAEVMLSGAKVEIERNEAAAEKIEADAFGDRVKEFAAKNGITAVEAANLLQVERGKATKNLDEFTVHGDAGNTLLAGLLRFAKGFGGSPSSKAKPNPASKPAPKGQQQSPKGGANP